MIFNTLHETIKCVGISLSLFTLLGFICMLRNKTMVKKTMFFSIAIFVLWRSFADISSSRYCCSAFVLCVICIPFVYVELKKINKTFIFFIIVFAVTCINAVKLNSSFRNEYIKFAEDSIREILRKNSFSFCFIQDKEYYRLRSQEEFSDCIFWIPQDKKKVLIEKILDEYSFWKNPIYFFLQEDQTKDYKKDILLPQGTTFKKHVSFIRNSSRSKFLSVYAFYPDTLQQFNPDSIYTRENNLIRNGDFEKILDEKTKRERMNHWISLGIDFYEQPTTKLPEHGVLLQVERSSFLKDYPLVFADSNNPISGKYSLHIKLNDKNDNIVFLLNQFLVESGVLSFDVRNLSSDPSSFVVSRFEYERTGDKNMPSRLLVIPTPRHQLFLPDNKTYHASIHFNSNDFTGYKTIFTIRGNHLDILIDNVSYSVTNK